MAILQTHRAFCQLGLAMVAVHLNPCTSCSEPVRGWTGDGGQRFAAAALLIASYEITPEDRVSVTASASTVRHHSASPLCP